MSAHEIRDPIAGDRFVRRSAHANAQVSSSATGADTICSIRDERDCIPGSTKEAAPRESADRTLLLVTSVEAKLLQVVRLLDVVARRQAPRIGFKANGKILFVELAKIVAVQAEGNYVSLRRRASPYLLRESLSSMAEKLRPYGFIRIHRSVVVNISAVQEIQPLPTGEYRLLVRGGIEYLVTRTYKDNLRDLAELWAGSDRICG